VVLGRETTEEAVKMTTTKLNLNCQEGTMLKPILTPSVLNSLKSSDTWSEGVLSITLRCGAVAYRWKALAGSLADGFTVRSPDGRRESHPFSIDWSRKFPF